MTKCTMANGVVSTVGPVASNMQILCVGKQVCCRTLSDYVSEDVMNGGRNDFKKTLASKKKLLLTTKSTQDANVSDGDSTGGRRMRCE